MIAKIIPEKRTNPEKDTFSYLVPDSFQNQLSIGSVVEVPFGKKNIRGVVESILKRDNKKTSYEIKKILKINNNLTINNHYINVAKWIAKYYFCSLGEAMALFLPPKIIRPRKIENLDKSQLKERIILSAEQEKIFKSLKNYLLKGSKKPALLHGVTGSGKTEIYIKLVAECLAQKKQAIILVPEIMLTPQIVNRFENFFSGQTCLMHSGLSESEKFFAYSEFSSNNKPIMIGPRSALLVPSHKLGLVIIDEEQEDAYKQEHDPRYHAVELAEKICSTTGAMLLLGTATPRIETYYKTQTEKNHLFTLKSRYQKSSLPKAKIIDLKEEFKSGNYSPISKTLQISIKEVLDSKKHVILFLNRRGVATFVSCRECGEVIACPNCSIPLVFHINKASEELNCHHCDYKTSPPRICPKCKSTKIKFFGAGIDKIANEIRLLFPEAKIKKVDAKNMQSKNSYISLFNDFIAGKIDILIGTQILAKGLDFRTVDLVGIVSADTGLHLPHFRANEKTFSLLTQVSGRSGRSKNTGKTIIQTYWPGSLAIKLASDHNYIDFYKSEIVEREKYNYPPFCSLVRIVSENKNEKIAKNALIKIAEKLQNEEINFIGPAKCFFSKISNKFRFHLIIKTKPKDEKKLFDAFLENPYLIWDKSPINLL